MLTYSIYVISNFLCFFNGQFCKVSGVIYAQVKT